MEENSLNKLLCEQPATGVNAPRLTLDQGETEIGEVMPQYELRMHDPAAPGLLHLSDYSLYTICSVALAEDWCTSWCTWGSVDIEKEIGEGFIRTDEGFVIEVDAEVVGAIQYHEEDDPMYRHANMDIFLATSRHGRGLGTEAIRLLARHLFEEHGHHRLTIDPAVDNAAAIRAYKKVGFRRVGIMRNYERGPDGVWHDGLLMDMLREELRP